MLNSRVGSQSQEKLLLNESAMATEEYEEDGSLEEIGSLTAVEKKFLLLVERGDCASIRRLLDTYKGQPDVFLIDCVDPLCRSALIMAIENENYELIQLLLNEGVKVKDALLHAIKEEYVEAVELLLEWEEQHHVPGTPYSWEAADRDTATFTPDITPLILAAHKNNYEIIKILLDRGATLPCPHDVKCGCDTCVSSTQEDSLRHSRSRINAYRALASPSLVCLSSKDPFLTAFELSWELRRLAKLEAEFRADYNDLRSQCQEFATTLLGHARTSVELQTLLNHKAMKMKDVDEGWEPGDRQTLDRLKLAIKYKQKKFVAHPSVQQLLAAMWYDGLPGFRRKTMPSQMIEVSKIGMMFPVYSMLYMMFPHSDKGQFVRKPFVQFICHSSSYLFFLGLLAGASQRIEYILLELLNMDEVLAEWQRKERGALPGFVESLIVIYIFGWVWSEIKGLWTKGLVEYVSDLWNVVDFVNNIFYVAWIGLRASAFYIVTRETWAGLDPYYKRETWDTFDPTLLSEGMFGAGMIFSYLKLVHIFSINPHLGPLQISLGRMVIDILKFFFIYTLVLFAFGCGLNQLLWYYADLERKQCYEALLEGADPGDSCFIWRRFANLFETSQSLFWASFGLVELDAFDLTGIKGFTRFWGLLMFGSYSAINIIVLLNMLIAMMSTSYQIISERSDTEWKFARSKLWISYFDQGGTVPVPFNIIPTPKSIKRLLGCRGKSKDDENAKKHGKTPRYVHIARMLVRRYVSAEEAKKQEQAGVTEDDVNEIRQDISSFRYELMDILKLNGMRTPNVQAGGGTVVGRKGKVMERRLMKDFQIGVIETAVKEAIMNEEGDSKDLFARIAKAIGGKKEKKDWNALVRTASVRTDHIGSKHSMKRKSSRRRKIEAENEALFSMDPDKLAEFNPKLQDVSAATRVAYAKFKTKVLIRKSDAADEEENAENKGETDATGTSTPKMGTPQLTPQLAHKLLKKKSQSLRFTSDQAPSKGKSRMSGAYSQDSGISPVDETPILNPIRVHAPEETKKDDDLDAIEKVAEDSGDEGNKETKSEPTSSEKMESSIPQDVLLDQTSASKSEKPSDFTVVQIEARQMSSVPEEEEGTGKKEETSKTAESPVKKVEETEKQPGEATAQKKMSVGDASQKDGAKKEKRRKSSASSLSAAQTDGQQGDRRRSSAFATGKSAITGQTRTGWL